MLQVAAANGSVISRKTASDSDKRTNNFAPEKTNKEVNETNRYRAYQSKSVELVFLQINSKVICLHLVLFSSLAKKGSNFQERKLLVLKRSINIFVRLNENIIQQVTHI